MAAVVNALAWRLRQFMAAAGLPGWAAAALAAGTLVTAVAVVLPAAREEQRLVEANAALSAQRKQTRARAEQAVPVATAADALTAFERRFEGPAVMARTVARLERSALRHGVTLEGASFRLDTTAGQPLARYTIDWPLKADYAALRRHIAQVLRDEPALALESVQMQRDDATQPRLSARLRWVLFVAPEARLP